MCGRCLYHPMSQVGSLLVVESSPLPAPQRPVLQSLLPLEPIEDPASWAWGLHPDNGLDYKAKDNLEVEVCLKNPAMINTAKCKLPLEVCLANPQHLASLGCSAALTPALCAKIKEATLTPTCVQKLASYEASMFDCQDNTEALCSLNLCDKHKFVVKC